MNATHTAGPWVVSGDIVVGPPEPYPNPKAQPMGRVVAKLGWDFDGDRGATGDLPWSVAKLNGQLIAAAPELLEACKLAFEQLKPGDIRKDFAGHVAKAALSKAIHKATT